jgi:hypothetical protein
MKIKEIKMIHMNKESTVSSHSDIRQGQRADLPAAQRLQIVLYVGGLFGAAAFATLAIGS